MSKDILHAFKHYGVTPDSVKRAEGVLAAYGIDVDEVQTVLQAVGYALLDCELYPAPEYLKRHGYLPFDPDDEVIYCGEKMKYAQQKELATLFQEFWEWFDTNTDALSLEKAYEKEKGVSCVWWTKEGDASSWRDTLPRDENYHTDGFTDEFGAWVNQKIIRAYLDGKTTLKTIITALTEG